MSAFKDDHAENLKNVEYAYEYGRSERELEIIKLLEEMNEDGVWRLWEAIKRLKGEQE